MKSHSWSNDSDLPACSRSSTAWFSGCQNPPPLAAGCCREAHISFSMASVWLLGFCWCLGNQVPKASLHGLVCSNVLFKKNKTKAKLDLAKPFPWLLSGPLRAAKLLPTCLIRQPVLMVNILSVFLCIAMKNSLLLYAQKGAGKCRNARKGLTRS